MSQYHCLSDGLKDSKGVLCRKQSTRQSQVFLGKEEVGGGLHCLARLPVKLEEFQKQGSGIKINRPAEWNRMNTCSVPQTMLSTMGEGQSFQEMVLGPLGGATGENEVWAPPHHNVLLILLGRILALWLRFENMALSVKDT